MVLVRVYIVNKVYYIVYMVEGYQGDPHSHVNIEIPHAYYTRNRHSSYTFSHFLYLFYYYMHDIIYCTFLKKYLHRYLFSIYLKFFFTVIR